MSKDAKLDSVLLKDAKLESALMKDLKLESIPFKDAKLKSIPFRDANQVPHKIKLQKFTTVSSNFNSITFNTLLRNQTSAITKKHPLKR